MNNQFDKRTTTSMKEINKNTVERLDGLHPRIAVEAGRKEEEETRATKRWQASIISVISVNADEFTLRWESTKNRKCSVSGFLRYDPRH